MKVKGLIGWLYATVLEHSLINQSSSCETEISRYFD